jgi:TM2 domain-containing membrane protein YozV
MFCPKCGKEVPDTASYCPYCGTSLKPTETVKAEPVNHVGTAPNQGYMQRSVLAAALLAIFLGCYGIHNFYLGYKSKAIAQLILGLCFVTIFVSAVWGLVEGIQILTGDIAIDGNGFPLKRDV